MLLVRIKLTKLSFFLFLARKNSVESALNYLKNDLNTTICYNIDHSVRSRIMFFHMELPIHR